MIEAGKMYCVVPYMTYTGAHNKTKRVDLSDEPLMAVVEVVYSPEQFEAPILLRWPGMTLPHGKLGVERGGGGRPDYWAWVAVDDLFPERAQPDRVYVDADGVAWSEPRDAADMEG